jgi:hypothetical protein
MRGSFQHLAMTEFENGRAWPPLKAADRAWRLA